VARVNEECAGTALIEKAISGAHATVIVKACVPIDQNSATEQDVSSTKIGDAPVKPLHDMKTHAPVTLKCRL
jgi:hypothetical protein